jgi:hypothetical protein
LSFQRLATIIISKSKVVKKMKDKLITAFQAEARLVSSEEICTVGETWLQQVAQALSTHQSLYPLLDTGDESSVPGVCWRGFDHGGVVRDHLWRE